MTSRTVKELLEEGKELGYKDEELLEWVRKERAEDKAREQRAQDLARKDQDLARKERAEEREVKKLELEAQIEASKAAAAASAAATGTVVHPAPKVVNPPKIPPFDESSDEIDTYIARFERVAKGADWKTTVWPTALASLLTGRAIEIYHQLTDDIASNFELLKAALLKGYDITPEGCRKKFRDAKFREGETAEQLACRLKKRFIKWVETDGCDETYEGVQDLILREQFIKQCPSPLTIFLKERKVENLQDCSKEADRWIDAHGHPTVYGKRTKLTPEVQDVGKKTADSLRQGASGSKESPKQRGTGCWSCGKTDHRRAQCPQLGKKQTSAAVSQSLKKGTECGTPTGNRVKHHKSKDKNLVVSKGSVEGKTVTAMLDGGSTTCVVAKYLVKPEHYTGNHVTLKLVNGYVANMPEVKVNIDTPWCKGTVLAAVCKNPVYDLVVGGINFTDPGLHNMQSQHSMKTSPAKNQTKISPAECEDTPITDEKTADDITDSPGEDVVAATTRAQAQRSEKHNRPLKVSNINDFVSPSEFVKCQEKDKTLNSIRNYIVTKKTFTSKGRKSKFVRKNNRMYRVTEHKGVVKEQLIVPREYRRQVFKLGHEGIMSGHMGHKKTLDRVQGTFFWPGMVSEISRWCKSCDVCQRTVDRGRVRPGKLKSMPIIDVPFSRVGVDIVGPITPRASNGARYILTLIDFSTRYAEAIPMNNIEATTVADALIDIYSRVGIPNEVLSDRGSQFTSGMMEEVNRLLAITQQTWSHWANVGK